MPNHRFATGFLFALLTFALLIFAAVGCTPNAPTTEVVLTDSESSSSESSSSDSSKSDSKETGVVKSGNSQPGSHQEKEKTKQAKVATTAKVKADDEEFWGATRSERTLEKLKYPERGQSNSEYLNGKLEFELQALETFESQTTIPDDQQKAALEIIRRVFKTQYRPSSLGWSKLLDDLKTVEGGEDDPVWNLASAIVYFEIGDSLAARDFAEKSTTQFRNTNYPSRIGVHAHHLLALCTKHDPRASKPGSFELEKERRKRCVNAVVWWLEKDMAADETQLQAVWWRVEQIFSDMLTKGHEDAATDLMKRVSRNLKVDRWLRAMVRTHFQFEQQRAVVVKLKQEENPHRKKELRKRSIELLVNANDYAEKAISIAPVYPEPYKYRIATEDVLTRDPKRVEKIFQSMLAVQPDYFPVFKDNIYRSFADTDDLTKTFDSVRQWTEGSADGMAQFMLFEAYWLLQCTPMAGRKLAQKTALLRNPEFLSDIESTLERIAKSSGPKADRNRFYPSNYFRTLQMVMAEKRDDYAEVARIDQAIRGQVSTAALAKMQISKSPTQFRAQAYALDSEFASEAKKVAKLANGNLGQRIRNSFEIEELADQVLEDDPSYIVKTHFQALKNNALFERYLSEDGEAKIRFHEKLVSWRRSDSERIRFKDRDGVNLIGNGRQTLVLTSDFEMPTSYRFDFHCGWTDGSEYSHHEPFFILGRVHGQSHLPIAISIDLVHRRLYLVNLGDDGSRKYLVRFEYPKEFGGAKLNCYLDNDYFEVRFFGNLVGRFQIEGFRPYRFLKMGMLTDGRTRETVLLTNMKARRWSAPPKFASAEDLIVHFDELIEDDDEDSSLWFNLACATQAAGDFETAIGFFNDAIKKKHHQSLCLFRIGECYERMGDYGSAIEAYQKSANHQADYEITVNRYTRRLHTPQSMSAFRYQYLVQSSPDPEVRKSFVAPKVRFSHPGPVWYEVWLISQGHAANGDLPLAARVLEGMNSLADDEYRDDIRVRVKELRDGNAFPDKREPSFYLKHSPKLFETLEHTLINPKPDLTR